ncbi:PQQ-binding-like beta-propeller repeat protein [Treponema sp. OMZ 857]|uniref:outer membrane protein assembly factor BamB family protein n=1 Tax=Treponema sp. OMZ 857 TaxID=1643513 RepID=UPI0020A5A081|nr:PQQ-binding-like beta-propeller repeat protein [Treponema sp. OMZ 857]UTC42656.1 PQQ-binding-like beta-propeller repeat protein [Treponema sp. OMZ 857]
MTKPKRFLTSLLTAAFSCMFLLIPTRLLTAQTAQTEQAQWSAVMAGETLCDPVLHGEYLYTLSSDQALNCIDYTGSFVWRRNIERTIKPFLSVSNSGILIIADASRMLQAVSGQGIYLWSVQLPEPALYAPYSTTDGRICVLTKSNLYCFSIKGKLKWQVTLSSPPARQLCETGAASLLLTLTNKDFVTVSLTGQVLNTKTLKKDITALTAAPGGYVMSTGDGILTYYRSTASQEKNTSSLVPQGEIDGFAVWQTQETAPLFMQNSGDELVCVYADGTVSARNITSNKIAWTVKLNSRITLPLYYSKTDGEYYIACKSIAAIISGTGSVKREQKILTSAFLPVITPSGILIAVNDWVINSWRLDTKIMQSSPQRDVLPQYHILKTQEKTQTLPFFVPYGDTGTLLSSIDEAVTKGTIGTNEAAYALTLQTILTNNQRAAYFPYDFTIYERARAAELLGLLESLEYRTILLGEASKTYDPTLAVAIIRALGFIAADPDGHSIESIQLLLQRCGVRIYEPAYAACDALTEIAKYGDKQTAGSAVKALFTIAAGAFPENIKQYARQKIKTIVE